MIKNERQYRISKAQADKFAQALLEFQGSPQSTQLHPLLQKAQQDAIRSQLDELQAQIMEYDALRSGQRSVLEVESFADLPRALIKARIAAGLSQKELGERLGLKEQQIQQYESTEYAAASISRVQEVIAALGIIVREEVFLPSAEVTKSKLFDRMKSIGIDRAFLLKQLLPQPLAARLQSEPLSKNDALNTSVMEAATILGRVFDLKPSVIFGNGRLQLNTTALGAARFKLPANVNGGKLSVYTVYAHYLALLALQATPTLEQKPVPVEPRAVREAILSMYGTLTFENALRYIWSLGIPVLPLTDPGTFHGACWRVDGRNVIVLKQQTRFPARWFNDGLHELGHAGRNPQEMERAIVETEEILGMRQHSEEEEEVQFFAEDVIFDGRADEIAQQCIARVRYIDGLSRIVPRVAAQEEVPADALANYIAYSLSQNGQDWWGSATNLQDKTVDPWAMTRDVFLANVDLRVLNEWDRAVLLHALRDREEE